MRDALAIVAERMANLKPATGTEVTTPDARMYLTGFPLKREPDFVENGRAGFIVKDWAEAAIKAFKFLHGDIKTPESDKRYDEVMRERQMVEYGLSPKHGATRARP